MSKLCCLLFAVATQVFAQVPPNTTCEVVAGALPAGLELNSSTCEIVGAPEGAGTFKFTLRAFAPGTIRAEKELELNVLPNVQLVIDTPSPLPFSVDGLPYRLQLAVSVKSLVAGHIGSLIFGNLKEVPCETRQRITGEVCK